MNSSELSRLAEQFLSAGGRIKECLPGDGAVRFVPSGLVHCCCGCNGDFTDHSMRAGESGRCASVVIRGVDRG